MKKLLIPISAVLLLCCGCAHERIRARDRDRDTTAGTPTLGEQLMDLQKAYDSKAISKKEYNDEKKKLMKDY